MVGKPELFGQLEGILTEEDFIDEDYHTVAKRLFDQYRDSGTVNPAAIVNLFEDIEKQNKTIIFYEAPHRLVKTLEELNKRFGNIDIVIAKELTKIHENYIRGKIEDIIPST